MSGGRLSCWLIGGDTLLEECGNILLRAGHEVRGVLTSSSRVTAWARARSLVVLDPASDYEPELARHAFDHLFAITHLELLPERILRLASCGSINFHDGPLPDYAGLNVPAWALLHGETHHGITWHVMTSEPDAGPILKQRMFEIAPDETSFSLNTKCFEAAIDSFAELVGELAARTSVRRPQDVLRRRVFRRHRRPRGACTIDWDRPAREIDALVRALDFGRYANPLGVAKIQHGGRALLVTRARAEFAEAAPTNGKVTVASRSANAAATVTGTILACDDREVRVATGRGVLVLLEFADLDGRALDPGQAVRALGLAPGVVVDRLAPERVERLSALDRRMSRTEAHWTRRLSTLDPIALPVPPAASERELGSSSAPFPRAIDVRVPSDFARHVPDHRLSVQLTAAFCAFLSRLTRRATFDIGYGDEALRRETEEQSWISARLPLRVEVDLEDDLRALVEEIATELADARGHGPWLLDLIARRPELQTLRGRAEPLLPVGVERCTEFATHPTTNGARWILEVRDAQDAVEGACRFVYDTAHVSAAHAASIHSGFEAFLRSLATIPRLALAAHTMVSSEELRLQRVEWNRTALPHRRDACVHVLFEEQVARTPRATALVCAGTSLTYAELNARANELADVLTERGVSTGRLVGIFVERSIDQVIAVLATLKAGGAYVPLDPAHPAARNAFLIEDSALDVIVTRAPLADSIPATGARVVLLDVDVAHRGARRDGARLRSAGPADLAYVIYTSGSTGRPKGVLVEHRNVASFFAAMDERIPHDPPGVWLALTSLSFDISVLELLWPLCRGFKVALHTGDEFGGSRTVPAETPSQRPLAFSLFYFSSDESDPGDGYRLLLEGARFADAHGFSAVWTPERHFHAFGGLYPNPAVTGAALAAITEHVQIRAGSLVMPLHHPIRVAEDWSLIDNLSAGRVGISFASGWHPDDFVLAPENYADAKAVMLRDIEVVRRLWRGEALPFPGPDGKPVEVRTLPRPVQPELPVWITSAGNVETYAAAGRIGANVLTHLLGQSVDELAVKIRAYRAARARAGLDPALGIVTLMLHTFVGTDEESVRACVRAPLERYLASSLDLLKTHAATFPAFRRGADAHSGTNGTNGTAGATKGEFSELDPEERSALLAHARDRYYETSGLFGTPERCLEQVARVRAVGVDEIACLIDFGVPASQVLASLPMLDRVRIRAQEPAPQEAEPAGSRLAALILSEGVTHLQCTPSLARILCSDPEIRRALHQVQHVFVGGEALPARLAEELARALSGSLTNMYGPTEATVWSSTYRFASDADATGRLVDSTAVVPIGRPIANTRFHVLDEHLQPLPIGVAGELFIAGDGVTRGYLRRPELNSRHFLADTAGATTNPLPGDGPTRMYRTGDLVRHRSDGTLEFLGRVDHQIKIRGHRVEPGEIEALIMREDVSGSALSEAVVVAREDTPGDQRLVAYLVPRGVAPDPALLRGRLATFLPESMLPARLVFLEHLPRNPNGKIDRRALPAPEARPLTECVPPETELETRLSELWRETLALPRVGVEDNFFDLGGHSLLIVRLRRRMHEVTTKPVPLTDLFRFPTIRSLARHLASDRPRVSVEEAAARGRRRRKSTPLRRQPVVEP